MLFNSYLFIFIFLPIVLIGWFSLNKIKKYELAEIFLIGMSLWFYAYFNFSYLFIIVGSCLFNFILSYLINRIEKKYFFIDKNTVADKHNLKNNKGNTLVKILGITGITVNLGILFYYKYYDFFIENINFIFQKDYNLKNILLPLGISFFTFQQLSYVIDRMRGTAPHYGLVDYMSFVTFFPQLIAGPIVLHSELIPQFKDEEKRKFNTDNFTDGCIQFILGLGKKVLIADTLALVVNGAYDYRYYFTTCSAFLFILAYIFELYFDFSGYCDMAMGIGKMFNYDIPKNFYYPYKSTSMKEFWNRWHMTLNRFFTNYVYIPLGGNRCGKLKHSINLLITFLVSGLWHGANWTFCIWGGIHGLAQIIENIFSNGLKKIRNNKVGKFFSLFGVFVFCNLTWIFFRAERVSDALYVIRKMCSGILSGELYFSDTLALSALQLVRIIGCFGLLTIYDYFSVKIDVIKWVSKKSFAFRWTMYLALIGVILFAAQIGESSFRYFQF